MFGMGVLGGGTMRRVGVRLDAEVGPYIAKLTSAGAATRQFGSEFAGVATKGDQTTKMLGRAALVAGGALVVGLGAATFAAIRYESAFAGVRKTVDGTPEQLDEVSDSLIGLSKRLPATAVEIANVAEEAGALGVQRGALVSFTETMINLGEATNLSSVEAAEGLARFSNVMGTPQEDVERLGSTLVDLGNKMAATEDEILEMGLRLAGAGNQIGLTEADVLAFAASLTSVGVNAEAGGSAFSRVMADIESNVAGGTDKVAAFAEVAGMSAEEFTRAWENDPAQALATFVQGLDRINESGGNVFGVLEDLEFGDIRVRDSLLRAAGASDLLNDSLDIAETAWEQNIALQAEADRRYETTAARVEIARNNITALGIELGDNLLPAIASGAEGVVHFTEGIEALPGPAKGAAVGLGGIFTAGLGIVGIAGTLGPKLGQIRTYIADLSQTAPALATGLRAGGVALGVLGVAGIAAIPVIAAMGKQAADEAESIEAFTTAIIDAEGATSALNVQTEIASQLAESAWGDDLRNMGVNAEVFIDAIATGSEELATFIDIVGQSPAGFRVWTDQLESGEIASSDFTDEIVRLKEEGMSDRDLFAFALGIGDIAANFESGVDDARNFDYAQRSVNEAAAEGADQFGLFRGELTGSADATDELSEAQKRLASGLETWADPLAAYNDLLANKQQQERESAESTEAMVDSIALTTEEWIAGLELQQAAYDNWERNLFRIARMGHEDIAAEFAAMGIESAEQVQQFVDSTPGQMRRLARLLRNGMDRGTDEAATELEIGLAIMANVGRTGATHTATAIAEALGVSVNDVRLVAQRYGIEIADGLNPVLAGLGRPQITISYRQGEGPGDRPIRGTMAYGGVVTRGVGADRSESHVAEIAPAGAWRVWAEDETGGEAYIPLAPDRRARSTMVLDEVARMFGYRLDRYAQGGFSDPADVPHPLGTGHIGPWPRPAVDAAMARVYNAARLWVAANAHPELRPGIGWQAMWQAVDQQFPGATLVSGYRPGAITATGNVSFHGMDGGRAIDIGPDDDPFLLSVLRWISRSYGPITQELIFTPAGAEQLQDGHSHVYSGITAAQHYDHVHWAMAHGGMLWNGGRPILGGVYDKGGWLPPGVSMAYNGTGMPERVVGPSGRGGSGPMVVQIPVVVQAPHYLGNVNDLSRAVSAALNEPGLRRDLESLVARVAGD